MSLKDTQSSKVYVSKRFRERYSAEFAKQGINLSQPFPDDKTMMSVIIDTLIDEDTANALMHYLKNIPRKDQRSLTHPESYQVN